MNYPPIHHQESNFKNAIRLIEHSPLALLITAENDTPFSTHVPMVFKQNSNDTILRGHLDRLNPQTAHILQEKKASLVFNGPETYISPAVYHSRQLPTWNYFKVHLQGRLIPLKDPKDISQSLVEMTAFLEPQKKFELTPNDPRMKALLNHIIGFEFHLDHWEGKYKISQDKPSRDQLAAKDQMIKQFPNQQDLIERLYAAHQTKKP